MSDSKPPPGLVDLARDLVRDTLLAAPTNIAFLGGNRTTLVSANLGRWHLTRLVTDLVGVAPHAPITWAIDAR